jgi:predicted P-loop ATPase
MSDQPDYFNDPCYMAQIETEMGVTISTGGASMASVGAPLQGEVISPEPSRPMKRVRTPRDPADDPEWMQRTEAMLAMHATVEEMKDGELRSKLEDGKLVVDWDKKIGRSRVIIRNANGDPLPILANAVDAIHNDPKLEGAIFFDDMRQEIMTYDHDEQPRPITDAEVISITKHLQHEGMPKLSVGTVHDAVRLVAGYYRRHPLKEYLDSLVWDGKERLPSFFPDYFATADTEYTRTIGRMMMIAAVKRVYDPGCKCDYAVVLESPQGHNKSTVLSILAGEDYFLDNLPRIDHKDSSSALRGKWIVEIAELAAMRKGEIEDTKAFITRRVEKYRPSYGRLEIEEPRTCIFVGTTNPSGDGRYLQDEENRRFWPVKVGFVDLARLRSDRDQLWAEAVHRMKAREQHWPEPEFEARVFKPEQDARKAVDPWEDPIAHYLERCPEKDRITSAEVATVALGMPARDLDTGKARRIGAVLKKLGWAHKRANGLTLWVRK